MNRATPSITGWPWNDSHEMSEREPATTRGSNLDGTAALMALGELSHRTRAWWVVRGLRDDPCPILVYQMGKVGSSAVYEALRGASSRPVFHVHTMAERGIAVTRRRYRARGAVPPSHLFLGDRLRRSWIQHDRPARIVTLVREPISRNVSAFFENIDAVLPDVAPGETTNEQLVSAFLERFDHGLPLTWFDAELRSVLDVDAYSHPFPAEAGFQVIEHARWPTLILKSDLPDRDKSKALASFVGCEALTVERDRVSANRAWGNVYQEFLESVVLRDDYVDRMLGSRYARHFFGPELNRIRERWTAP